MDEEEPLLPKGDASLVAGRGTHDDDTSATQQSTSVERHGETRRQEGNESVVADGASVPRTRDVCAASAVTLLSCDSTCALVVRIRRPAPGSRQSGAQSSPRVTGGQSGGVAPTDVVIGCTACNLDLVVRCECARSRCRLQLPRSFEQRRQRHGELFHCLCAPRATGDGGVEIDSLVFSIFIGLSPDFPDDLQYSLSWFFQHAGNPVFFARFVQLCGVQEFCAHYRRLCSTAYAPKDLTDLLKTLIILGANPDSARVLSSERVGELMDVSLCVAETKSLPDDDEQLLGAALLFVGILVQCSSTVLVRQACSDYNVDSRLAVMLKLPHLRPVSLVVDTLIRIMRKEGMAYVKAMTIFENLCSFFRHLLVLSATHAFTDRSLGDKSILLLSHLVNNADVRHATALPPHRPTLLCGWASLKDMATHTEEEVAASFDSFVASSLARRRRRWSKDESVSSVPPTIVSDAIRERLKCSASFCGKVEVYFNQFRPCRLCDSVQYCSSHCRRRHWFDEHSVVCVRNKQNTDASSLSSSRRPSSSSLHKRSRSNPLIASDAMSLASSGSGLSDSDSEADVDDVKSASFCLSLILFAVVLLVILGTFFVLLVVL